MSNTASLRAAAFVASGAVWSALVVLAFTSHLKLPDFNLPVANETTIVVVTEPPPVMPLTPKTPPTATLRTVADEATPQVVTLPFNDPINDPVLTVDLAPAIGVGPPAPVIINPQWLARPGAREFARFYPARARDREKEGRVTLDCIVAANGAIGCRVAREAPEGWGFGDAALKIAPSFRLAPRLEDGRPAEGGTVRVDIAFQLDR